MHAELEQRLRYCHNLLPTLPGVALQILELAKDPDAEVAEVAKAITVDPALVLKILRIANSPFYGLRRKSDNLRQAINLLGLHATLTLALSFSLSIPLRGKRTALDTALYWHRSLIAAVASRTLGVQQGISRAEELFLAGLLQDIGMLVFDSVMPDQYGSLIDAARIDTGGSPQLDFESLTKAERATLGADHAEVGAWLLRYWHLPEYLQWAVAGSQDPANVHAPEEWVPLLCCVAVSGLVADAWLNPADKLASVRAAQAAQRWLGVDTEGYFSVLNAMAVELPAVSALFDVKLIDANLIEGVLATAKEMLEVQNLLVLQDIIQTKQKNIILESQTRSLEQQSRLDPLTGLFNRGWLERVLIGEFDCANQNGWPLSMAFIDLDYFKQINDNYGHPVGDEVLVSVARALIKQLRQNDIVARYGGDEFVVLLPGVSLDPLRGLFQRIASAISTKEHLVNSAQPVHISVSIGLASHLDRGQCFENPSALLQAADKMVYVAKQQGRAKIVMFPGEIVT